MVFINILLLFIVNTGSQSFFLLLLSAESAKFLFCEGQQQMDTFKYNNFIFSSKYRIWRHVAFWLADVIFIVLLYSSTLGLWRSVIHNFTWLPARFLYTYPLILWFIPKYLFKNKYIIFSVLAILWGIGGWFLNIYFR